MLAALKFLHVGAIAAWVAGILYLPAILWAHRHARDQQDFARLRMGSRFVYMGLASPAACVAVGTGAALLFLGDALHPWMFVKLLAVAALVVGHVRLGYVLTHLADEEAKAPTLRLKLLTLLVAASSLATLYLVLAKPEIGDGAFPDRLLQPGVIGSQIREGADPAGAPSPSIPPPPPSPS